MREKKRCRWLALLLAVVMLLSVLPTAVFAEGESSTDTFYKIVHLDCGRKYFTVDWVKALIKEIAADGYTHLELAFGNDGLRFLLDDMSVTVSGTTYSSAAVKAGIQAGNKAYYDFGTNEWTQSEMDEIIAAAKAAGIEIIPLLNTPGHMDAIVDCMEYVGIANPAYSTSNTTVDLKKSSAVEFTKEFVFKYIDYFAGKGCKIFNLGADEYANDITGDPQFGTMLYNGYYKLFGDYVNAIASQITAKGMTPMAFNDGIYYNENTSVKYNSDILVSYWTPGWSGFDVASTSYLAGKELKLINTNGAFYYVLGKGDNFDSGYTYADNWSNTSFNGTNNIVSNPVGATFCIWCDYPNAETETIIAEKTRLVMRALSKKMDGESIDNLDESVVPGGFNADGSLTVLDLTSKIPGLQTQMALNSTQTLELGESATWTSSNENVITLASTARSVVSPSVVATAVGVGSATITAETDSTVYAATVNVASDTTDLSDTVLPGSGTAASYVLDTDGLDADAQYLIVHQESATSGKALNTSKGSVDVTISGSNATPAGDASAALWTYTTSTYGYYKYLTNGSNYLYPSRSRRWGSYTYSLNIDTNDTSVSINNQSNGQYRVSNTDKNSYVAYSSGWGAQKDGQNLYFYKYTPGTQTWTVDPALQQQRIIDLTVSNDGYTDESWNAYQTALTAANDKLSEVQNTTYSSENAAQAGLTELIAAVDALEAAKDALKKSRSITVNYQTADGTQVKTETLRVAEDAASVTLDTPFSAGGKTYAVNNPTLALTTATSYTVTVTEVQEDLTGKTLTVEFWITNQRVTANGDTSMEIAAATAGVYSENGVMLSELVPSEGTSDSNPMLFWKGTRLDSDHHQTTDGGVDMTKSGNDFTYIRYWNGSWAYSADGKSWADVADGDQIVAYYLQRTDVTDEITTLVVDWGPQKDNWSSGLGYLGTKYVLVDYSVKYESGEESPSSFPTKKSLGFHCDVSTEKNGYYYRDLGMVRGLETKDYEIYMITLTPTSDDPRNILASTAAGNSSYSYRGTEVVAWAATEADLDNSGLGKYTSISGDYTYSIGGEPIVSGLQIYRQHGMKVTFYVRAKVTEDSLSVHYIDQTVNHEFYSYNIAVVSGTLFDANIGLASPWKGPLANGSVENSLGKTQTVSADLSTMPAIGAQYRYSDYTCESVTRSGDGKDVYLYYTFNNAKKFVIDFGLPLKITTNELGITGNWTSATVSGAKYGTATATIGDGVTYTPTKVLTDVESLQLTLTDSTGSVTHQIYIYPASNVLYEDDFLTVDEEKSGTNKWVKANATVSPQQSANQTKLYGYDDAYKTSTGNSMGSAWTITGLSSGNGSKYLTTTFTGNGFDLIGTCGPDTGYVYLLLQGAENKLVVIDTSYVGGGTLYQVPLAHEMLTNGTYTAYIRAAYRKGTTTAGSGDAGTQMSRAAAFSMSAAPTALDSVYDMVDGLFADGFEIDDVEYIYFDDASALAELENSSRATYAMSYALDSASAAATADAGVNTTTATRRAGDTVTIDGFRVYRGTNDAYIESERGREYVNVLDKVQGEFAAYVEGNANGTGYEKGTYESQGGPQNEIYLVAGQTAVVLQTGLQKDTVVQVSARAVSGTANLNGTEIQSQTEMYYEVTVGENGVITIANIEGATGMLAIANLKLPAGTTLETPTEKTLVTAFAMMRSYSAAPAEPDPEQPGTEEPAPKPVFTPETFKTKVSSLRTRSRKIVTLTITASTDVDHVVVNGKTYYPMNKLLVKWGLSKTYVFTIMDTAGASETRSFEIVAYNADGLASSTYTDAG